MKRRVVDPVGRPRRAGDSGETLIELIVAVSIMGAAGVIFLGLITDTVLFSRTQTASAATQTLITSLAEQATAIPFVSCAGGGDYEHELTTAGDGLPTTIPAGYSFAVNVIPWNPTADAGAGAYTGAGTLATAIDASPATNTLELESADPSYFTSKLTPTVTSYPIRVVEPAPAQSAELMTVTGATLVTGNPRVNLDLTVTRAPTPTAHTEGAEVVDCPHDPSRLQRLDLTVVGPPGSAPVSPAEPQGQLTQAVSVAKRGPVYLPSLHTTATGSGMAGSAVLSDAATIVGGVDATGTLSFDLYGPYLGGATPTCLPPAAYPVPPVTATATVPGTTPYTYGSGSVTPAAAGTYEWIASYSGDTANQAATSACTDHSQSVTIAKATPAIALTTTTTPSPVDSPIRATAALSAASFPAGDVIFTLYGPNGPGDASCTTVAFTSSPDPVTGTTTAGTATSDVFTPTAMGDYYWTATYGGDPNNDSAATPCSAATKVTVTP